MKMAIGIWIKNTKGFCSEVDEEEFDDEVVGF
jgi:hypothetical protein